MLYGDGPASCSECGGALLREDETCPCGGHDHRYTSPRRAAMSGESAMEQLWAKRHGPGERPLSWQAAMTELRRRYVPEP